ncbi:MAG: flagellar protein FhlB [Alphaproteobacteria bacterium]|nr:flagellar protein FhlB [Alphaproteobacteria bacterium]
MPIDLTYGEEEKPAQGLKNERQKTAVAIEGGGPNALPKVIASGRGLLAEQILRLAFENNIKVRQDGDLVELLAMLDLDHHIPAQAVVAVAEILARVFEANSALANPQTT